MKKCFTFLLLFGLFISGINAQTADDIIEKYLENIGGKDAWRSLQSMKMSGSAAMQGMEFPIVVFTKRPNFEKVQVDVQGMQIVEAYDGNTAWSVNPFQGQTNPTRADEEMNKEAAKKTFEDELLDYAAKGHRIEKLADQEVEGTMTYQIKLTKKTGDEQIYFFDQENFVPIMFRSYALAGPLKGQTVDTYMSDYQEVNSLMIPFSMVQKMNGQEFMKISVSSVDLNPEIETQIFTFPVTEKPEMVQPAQTPKETPVKMEATPQKKMMEEEPKTMDKKKPEKKND